MKRDLFVLLRATFVVANMFFCTTCAWAADFQLSDDGDTADAGAVDGGVYVSAEDEEYPSDDETTPSAQPYASSPAFVGYTHPKAPLWAEALEALPTALSWPNDSIKLWKS